MSKINGTRSKAATSDQGFTLVEVLISMVILVVGLLMMLALFTKGLSTTQFANAGLIAKQKAHEQLEAIYAARNNGLPWDKIENSGTGNGIFLNGFQPLYRVVEGAADDASVLGSVQSFNAPYSPPPPAVAPPCCPSIPDFFIARDAAGNFSQVALPAGIYSRQIVIVDDNNDPNLKHITVTVNVGLPGMGTQSYSVNGLIANGQ